MQLVSVLIASLLGTGVGAASVAGEQGPDLGSTPVSSTVHFRGIDSFWRGNASHVDLYNVKLVRNPGGKADMGDTTLQVFIQDPEERARIKQRLETDRQLLPYKRASMHLPVPTVEIVDAKLDPSTCDQVWDGSTFFDAPWYHNVFHMHAKNIIPTALVMATTPSLVHPRFASLFALTPSQRASHLLWFLFVWVQVPGVGACTELPCREQLPKRTLFHYMESTQRPLMLSNVQLALFDEVNNSLTEPMPCRHV